MDYNIHLHLPGGTDQTVSSARPDAIAEAPRSRRDVWFESFLDRVKHCYNWRSVYELSEEFNKIGLTIHDTNGGRKLLCRMEDGRPVTGKIVDDYIFVGSRDALDEEVSERALEVMMHFVEGNASSPQKLVVDSQSYDKFTGFYGNSIRDDRKSPRQDPLNLFRDVRSPIVEANPTRALAKEDQEIELMSRLLDLDDEQV